MRPSKTSRGFDLIKFEDHYQSKCSLQKSSLATEDAIWLGIDSIDAKVLATEAHHVGLTTFVKEGWIPFPIPDEVLVTTRMHLTRDQVKKLLPYLNKFVKTGELV